jgi:membrane protein
MAGATAFFTTFAIPPILIILFQVFSLFLNRKFVGSEIMQMLTTAFGNDVARQIRQITIGFRTLANTWYIAILGFLFMIFVATTLFSVIKNTLNDIWNIKVKDKPGMLFYLRLRGKSIAVILIAGILFLATIFLDSFQVFASENAEKIWHGGGKYFKSGLNGVVSFVVITSWFIVLFHYLADGRPSWRSSIAGSIVTGILFAIGKTALSFVLKNSNLVSIYGASASIVLVLLFVFYSSFILYFGACFIKVYSGSIGKPIQPMANAYRFRLQKLKE